MKKEKKSLVWVEELGMPKYRQSARIAPSAAEEVVMACLVKKGLAFLREVSFDGLVNSSTGNPLRFDFYIPSKKMIIEFDGGHHKDPIVKRRDELKDEFAKMHGIEVVRINRISNIFLYFELPEVPLDKVAYMNKNPLKKITRTIENPLNYITRKSSPHIREQIELIKKNIGGDWEEMNEYQFCRIVAVAELYVDKNFEKESK